ncbi:MAG: DNA recombination protein RmuC [Duodenibacillus sp.]|nr:DNA recombination protein RmuC [Duodenibacillus sp.]
MDFSLVLSAAVPAPVMVAGVVASFAAGAAVVWCVMRAAQKREDEMRERNEVSQGATRESIEALRRETLGACEHLKREQIEHFSRFVHLMQQGLTDQSSAALQLQNGLFDRLTQYNAAQQTQLAHLTDGVAGSMSNLRETLSRELDAIRTANDKALAGMRETVDEKLQTTLNSRIAESFRTVEAQLEAVHQGLGRMREMAQNVDGLRRVLVNVKTRGTFGEVQLSRILEEILTPSQYDVNVATRPGAAERVEFAVRLPGAEAGSIVYLPIDAKFPMEDYDRLLLAADAADKEAQEKSLKALKNRILLEAQKIRDKYVEPPYTTEFAVLYLPVESLWAEVIRMPGLLERVQRDFRVTIAGPTVIAALLNSLQMGFRTLAIEQKSALVWHLLGEVKAEFVRFAEAVAAMQKKVEGVSTALGNVRTRTSVMARRLKEVETHDASSVASKAVSSADCVGGLESVAFEKTPLKDL